MDNASGQGKGSLVPEEVKGLCWGGFFWNWIWGIFNRVWLSFLIFIPVVGFIVAFVLLFKGREWAWQNRTWESVEHFNKIQRRWTIAGLIPVALVIIGIVLAVALPAFLGGSSPTPSPMETKPAAPRPPAPKPAPKPAATVTPPAPSAAPESRPAAAVPDKPGADIVAAKPAPAEVEVTKGAPAKAEPESAPMPRKAAAKPAPAPRARATLPPRRAAESAPAAAAAPEVRIIAPKYNDVMTAVLRPDRAGVVELLDLGRWVDKPDTNGVTPLVAAVRLRDATMVELLLSRGANPNASGSRGMSALDIARANGDAAMASLLQRHGAK